MTDGESVREREREGGRADSETVRAWRERERDGVSEAEGQRAAFSVCWRVISASLLDLCAGSLDLWISLCSVFPLRVVKEWR